MCKQTGGPGGIAPEGGGPALGFMGGLSAGRGNMEVWRAAAAPDRAWTIA
jgi:hypothetical protein